MLENTYCTGLNFFSKKYCYVLFQTFESSIYTPGLKMLNISKELKHIDDQEKKFKYVDLKKFDIGPMEPLEYNEDLQRLGVVTSLTHFVVFPPIHLNLHKWMGMSDDSNMYIATKVINGKYVALTKDSLYVWDLYTSKLLWKRPLG
jgi:hypothetical protein